MEALVPTNEYELDLMLTAMRRFSGTEVGKYVNPVEVDGDRLVFDLKWFVNMTYFRDFYVPLLPGKRADAERLAETLWRMMMGRGSLPAGYTAELFACVDTSVQTSDYIIRRLTELAKKLNG